MMRYLVINMTYIEIMIECLNKIDPHFDCYKRKHILKKKMEIKIWKESNL